MERPGRGRSPDLHGASAVRVHSPGASPVQRHAPRQHPDGKARGPGHLASGDTTVGDGARRRVAREGSGHGCGAARGEALRRAGAADRGCPDVRAEAGADDFRRSFQRARRRDGAATVGPAVRAARCDQPGRIAPPGGLQARRSDRGAQGGPCPGAGQAG